MANACCQLPLPKDRFLSADPMSIQQRNTSPTSSATGAAIFTGSPALIQTMQRTQRPAGANSPNPPRPASGACATLSSWLSPGPLQKRLLPAPPRPGVGRPGRPMDISSGTAGTGTRRRALGRSSFRVAAPDSQAEFSICEAIAQLCPARNSATRTRSSRVAASGGKQRVAHELGRRPSRLDTKEKGARHNESNRPARCELVGSVPFGVCVRVLARSKVVEISAKSLLYAPVCVWHTKFCLREFANGAAPASFMRKTPGVGGTSAFGVHLFSFVCERR